MKNSKVILVCMTAGMASLIVTLATGHFLSGLIAGMLSGFVVGMTD